MQNKVRNHMALARVRAAAQERATTAQITYRSTLLSVYPKPFADRVSNACDLLLTGSTPSDIHQRHGLHVLRAALEVNSRLNSTRRSGVETMSGAA